MSQNEVTFVNACDKRFTSRRWLLCFGAYGWTRLVVWANSADEAFDIAIDWIVDHAHGLLCDDEVEEEYKRAIAEGLSEEAAMVRAEMDTSSGGNAGNRVRSWEWTLDENPSRELILRLLGRAA